MNILFPARLVAALSILILVGLLLAGCATAPEGIVVGAEAPAFTLPAADGRQITLADYRGQPVLLFFHMAVG